MVPAVFTICSGKTAALVVAEPERRSLKAIPNRAAGGASHKETSTTSPAPTLNVVSTGEASNSENSWGVRLAFKARATESVTSMTWIP